MGTPFALIKNRMAGLGIAIDPYIVPGTLQEWAKPLVKIFFQCRDVDGLTKKLIENDHIGTDSVIGASLHNGATYRENNQFDSLHIIIQRRHDPNPAKRVGMCEIHLDTVSPVAGRDPQTRQLQYDYGKVLQHLATDAWHTPLIVPSSERGLVFGLRF